MKHVVWTWLQSVGNLGQMNKGIEKHQIGLLSNLALMEDLAWDFPDSKLSAINDLSPRKIRYDSESLFLLQLDCFIYCRI